MLPKKILLCTDFSENSDQARVCAVEYAKAFDSELHILHVVDSWAGLPAYSEGVYVHVADAFGQMQELSNAKLEETRNQCGADVRVKMHSKTGVASDEIVRLADEESVDLIVMGTHGWTGFKHLLLGSVAERVLRTATCPVMVVRPSE